MKIHVIITMIALFVFLIAAIWFAKKKYKINLSVLGLGAVAFFVSSQVLEKIVHLLVLHPQKDGTVPLMTGNPLLYVIYGICMAALFEETARLIFFKWLEKKRTLEDSDALAYGLGHGGLELLYIGIASLLNLFILFSAVESQNPNIMQLLPESTLTTINNLAAWQIYLLGLERILALLLQVGLTFWVYQAVRQKKWIYLVAAYGLHALFDLAPSLSQVGWLSNPLLYVIYGVCMAALFEETARLVFFKWLEKKRSLEDSDALAYGLGHGGLELLYLGMGSLISLLILFSLLESSNPDLANLLPKNTLETVQSLSGWQVYLLGVERVLALVMQIGLSFWVYQAVRQKNWIYLVTAYGLHALFDLAPSLSQVGWISNPLLVEGLLAVEVVLFVYFTKTILYKK